MAEGVGRRRDPDGFRKDRVHIRDGPLRSETGPLAGGLPLSAARRPSWVRLRPEVWAGRSCRRPRGLEKLNVLVAKPLFSAIWGSPVWVALSSANRVAAFRCTQNAICAKRSCGTTSLRPPCLNVRNRMCDPNAHSERHAGPALRDTSTVPW